jgi:hypothetical protein
LNQLSFFPGTSGSNNIVKFNRNPVVIDNDMLMLVDYITNVMSSEQFDKCVNLLMGDD